MLEASWLFPRTLILQISTDWACWWQSAKKPRGKVLTMSGKGGWEKTEADSAGWEWSDEMAWWKTGERILCPGVESRSDLVLDGCKTWRESWATATLVEVKTEPGNYTSQVITLLFMSSLLQICALMPHSGLNEGHCSTQNCNHPSFLKNSITFMEVQISLFIC